MEALSPSQIDEFRAELTRRKAHLMSEIESKLAQARSERVAPDAVSVTDGGDKALLEAASGLDLAIASRDIEELRAVEAAEARITEGRFGVCVDCGGQIATERLRAYPSAVRCTDCQNELEHRSALHTSKL